MARRFLPYGIAVAAVALAAAALGLLAWLLHIPRIETFLLVFVLLVGAIGWRYGRGPAIAGTVAFVLVSDYYFLAPRGNYYARARCRQSLSERAADARAAARYQRDLIRQSFGSHSISGWQTFERLRGSAAAQCGKALPYWSHHLISFEATPRRVIAGQTAPPIAVITARLLSHSRL